MRRGTSILKSIRTRMIFITSKQLDFQHFFPRSIFWQLLTSLNQYFKNKTKILIFSSQIFKIYSISISLEKNIILKVISFLESIFHSSSRIHYFGFKFWSWIQILRDNITLPYTSYKDLLKMLEKVKYIFERIIHLHASQILFLNV